MSDDLRDRFSVTHDGDGQYILFIAKVTMFDNGLYICDANGFGLDVAEAWLTVNGGWQSINHKVDMFSTCIDRVKDATLANRNVKLPNNL